MRLMTCGFGAWTVCWERNSFAVMIWKISGYEQIEM